VGFRGLQKFVIWFKGLEAPLQRPVAVLSDARRERSSPYNWSNISQLSGDVELANSDDYAGGDRTRQRDNSQDIQPTMMTQTKSKTLSQAPLSLSLHPRPSNVIVNFRTTKSL
jgi:hypothetical protein